MQKEAESERLQNKILELERQLGAAQAVIHAFKANKGHDLYKLNQGFDGNLSLSNEEGFKLALPGLPFPLMIWREDGKIIMVNDIFTEISGYQLNDIPTYEEWLHKAFDERVLHQPSLVFYEELPGSDVKKWREYEIKTQSGEKRIWDFSDAVLGTDQDNRWLMLTMAVDITERRQIEEQLEENEEKFAVIFDKAPFAAALSNFPNAVMININEEFERLFGFTRQEVIGRTAIDLDIRPDALARSQIMEGVRTRGSARNVESALHTKSGEGRVLLLNVDIVSIGGEKYLLQTAEDITERKKMENALAEREQQYRELAHLLEVDRARLRTILEHLPVGVWLATPEGQLIGKNAQADRIWAGEAPLVNDLKEYPQYSAWYPGSVVPLKPDEYPMAIALRTGQPVEPVELDIRRFDGSEGTVLVSAVPIHDDQGMITGVVAVNVDITDRKQAEQERRLAEERYTTLFNSVQEGFAHYRAVYDDLGEITDLQVVEINPAGARISGVARENQIGKTWRQVWPDLDKQFIDVVQRVDEAGDSQRFDYHNNLTGRIYDVLVTRLARGEFIASFNDITERKKAEEELRRSEERFAKAFHSSPDAIIISRISDGLIIEVNEGWSKIFGHKANEVLGQTSIGLGVYVNPSDREIAIRQLQKNGVLRDFELQVRRKSGEIRQSSLSAEQIEMNGVQYLLTTMRDITERKEAEEHIAYQARLLASVNDAIVGTNASYQITAWNAVAETTYGWKAEEVLGRNGVEILQTIWPEEDASAMRLKIAETGRWRGEATQLRKDGSRIPVEVSSMVLHDEQGQVIGYVSVNRDITERKRVEQALRESEEGFRSLADSMPQLVWTALPDGRVDYYNQRHKEYQIIKQVNGEDWEWAPVLHPDDLSATVDAWLHSIETGEIYQIEHRVRMQDGSYRWHLSRGIPMRDDRGRVLRWFGTATDIHDLKLAEEKLKINASLLERSNRELEQFAFMASHDLQEPLRKIEMFGDLLLERAASLQEHERMYLERMRNAAGRMRDMIEGLLRLSRVATQGKPFVPVELSKVTAEVLSDFEDQIHRTKAEVEVEPLPTLTGDPSQLRQLMQNLIGNALKYHHPGKPAKIRIYANQFPEVMQIYVEDRGIGFEQEDAERIFEPFQRLVGRSQYEGSGIGLAICRRIVDRHGGEIAAISEPGQGTTFIVTLPIHPIIDEKENMRKNENE